MKDNIKILAVQKPELEKWLSIHPDWEIIDDELAIQMEFADFITAFGFVTSVAILSEKQGHHPTIQIAFNRVQISMNTHDADNKITHKDFKLAEAIDEL